MSQGRQPVERPRLPGSLRLLGRYLERAVADSDDREAREQVMWAATLAGIAFGNTGCTSARHGLCRRRAGRDFHPLTGYPGRIDGAARHVRRRQRAGGVPRHAYSHPARHAEAAACSAPPASQPTRLPKRPAGPGRRLIRIMRAVGMPNGLTGVGYDETGAPHWHPVLSPQQRLLQNAPIETSPDLLGRLIALRCNTGEH